MGAFSERMFRFFIIPLLLVICESFPYIKKGSLEIINIQDKRNKIIDNDVGKIRTELNLLSTRDFKNNILNSYNTVAHSPKNVINSLKSSDIFNVVQRRTETAISDILNTPVSNSNYMNTKESTAVGFPDGTQGDIHRNSKRKHRSNINNLEKVISNILSSAKHKTTELALDTTEDSNTMSKRDTNLLPEYRHRRSYFDVDLDDIFAEEEGSGVVFGAHTSPCGHADRYYCMNGGTCFYLLNVKSCQCAIGYTGSRCESLNQEYLMALFAEEFFG